MILLWLLWTVFALWLLRVALVVVGLPVAALIGWVRTHEGQR